MNQENEKSLTEAALFMLLRVIELNGGRVYRGAIQQALDGLVNNDLLKVKFTPESPKNLTEFDFMVTKKGQETLDLLKEAQVKQLEVQELKEKKGRPTVIRYKGNNYILQPAPVKKTQKAGVINDL